MSHHHRGFTLIEMIVVVAIAGILAALATQMYSDQVISSRRTDGRATLMNVAAVLDKCRAVYGIYNHDNCSIGDGDVIDTSDEFYQVTVESDATTFLLTADPTPGSPQVADTECTSITINHLAQQDGTGSDPDNNCW